jgi:hypothetical protein
MVFPINIKTIGLTQNVPNVGANGRSPLRYHRGYKISVRKSWTSKTVQFLTVSFCLDLFLLSYVPSAIAHQVKIAEEVGATIHVEPNDNPRAGENSQTWFALTRKGGKSIAVEECDCQLAVYKQPRKPGDSPVLKPALKPLSAEQYKDIPGADIVFPQVGVYQVALTGKAKDANSFKPFDLQFDVTVAAGNTVTKPIQEIAFKETKEISQEKSLEVANKNTSSNQEFGLPWWIFALPLLGVGGFFVWKKIK